uniref:Uncharacterized protein n=1 Tax=Anopheles coluzzii TaxID=1518534 RepID=A0A8W7PK31_ANOCL
MAPPASQQQIGVAMRSSSFTWRRMAQAFPCVAAKLNFSEAGTTNNTLQAASARGGSVLSKERESPARFPMQWNGPEAHIGKRTSDRTPDNPRHWDVSFVLLTRNDDDDLPVPWD